MSGREEGGGRGRGELKYDQCVKSASDLDQLYCQRKSVCFS